MQVTQAVCNSALLRSEIFIRIFAQLAQHFMLITIISLSIMLLLKSFFCPEERILIDFKVSWNLTTLPLRL